MAEIEVSEFVMAAIDLDALKQYIFDYYGSAAFSGFPVAIVDYSDIELLDDERLINIANNLGIDIRKFLIVED